MTTRRGCRESMALVAAAALVIAGCGDDGGGTGSGSCERPSADEAVIDPGDGGSYSPSIDPAEFVAGVDHPYLPLEPGSVWRYESIGADETEQIEVVVTDHRQQVMGITAVVVRDTVTVDGEMVEDTFDWFAQDRDGNVWYLGEESREYEDGQVSSTEGSWEAGVDGALPGIVMPAVPEVGMAYRQEYLACEAEDMGEVVRVGDEVTVPAGSFAEVVVTRDWNPLEPDVVEEKAYAPGVGLVREVKVEGGDETVALVSFTAGS